MTGCADGSDRIVAACAEGLEFDVVAKPVPPEKLLERISRLLSGDAIPKLLDLRPAPSFATALI
jgi:hypothetical protein